MSATSKVSSNHVPGWGVLALVRLGLLLLMFVFSLMSQQAFSAWSVTEFQVMMDEPVMTEETLVVDVLRKSEDFTDSFDVAQKRYPQMTKQRLEEIEQYMAAVARRYSEMGFKQPKLEPVVTRKDGQKAYRIYLYEYPDGTPAYFSGGCGRGRLRQLIHIDIRNRTPSATIDNQGKITDKGYQDLAHELFHAVQAAYPMFYTECNLGHWISEGTAQAIGVDMARELRGIDKPKEPVRWGLRQYDRPLRLGPKDHDTYETASFWRYIGEKAALAGGMPGPHFVAPDYRYLNSFFNLDSTGASEKSELQWVDKRLRNHTDINLGLSRLYPYFVSTFAAYINNRVPRSATSTALENRTNWLGKAFDHCPYLPVNINSKPAERELKLEPVAAGCWLFGSDIPAALAVQVTAEGAPPDQLAALAVGTHDGQSVGKPKIVSVNGQDLAQWTFRVDNKPGEQTVFIISNVAKEPEKTRAVKVKVKVTVSGWDSSLMGQK